MGEAGEERRAAGSLSFLEAGHRGSTRDSWMPQPQGRAKPLSQLQALAACEEGRCGEEGSRPNRPMPVSPPVSVLAPGLCLLHDSKSLGQAGRTLEGTRRLWGGQESPADQLGVEGGGLGGVGSLWMEQSWRGSGWERLCIENGLADDCFLKKPMT